MSIYRYICYANIYVYIIHCYNMYTIKLIKPMQLNQTAIKLLIARMSWQGVSIGKISSSILKSSNKHNSDFNNVCQSKQELLNLIS